MRIVMLSDAENGGGAAVAACRLADGLACGHEVTRCVLNPDGQQHSWSTWSLALRPLPRRHPWIERCQRLLPFWTDPVRRQKHRVEGNLQRALDRLRPDVINVHNIHGGAQHGWSVALVDLCLKYAPVVWTLHDMWSFTGRCAYAYDCRKFETGCDATCPTPQDYPKLEPVQIPTAWEQRRDMFARHPELTAVTPSRWLQQEALRGFWAGHRVEVIPNGVPIDRFRPLDQAAARRQLGIHQPGPVILLAAQLLNVRRKGGDILPKIWQHVAQRPLTLLTMGEGAIAIPDPGINVVSLGWVTDPQQQALAYNAADLLLHPAPVDNFPNVVLEAMACGTPGVGLPIGGVPEMLLPGQTGWLTDNVSPKDLGRALQQALDELHAGRSLRVSCRARAEQEFSLDVQANRYLSLFHALRAARHKLSRRAG